MANQFMTDSAFQAASTRISKWKDLPINVTFRVNEINERVVNIDGKSVTAKFAILEEENGNIRKSWLTSIVQEELENITLSKRNVYLRSYGLKSNKQGNRQYYDFEIIQGS